MQMVVAGDRKMLVVGGRQLRRHDDVHKLGAYNFYDFDYDNINDDYSLSLPDHNWRSSYLDHDDVNNFYDVNDHDDASSELQVFVPRVLRR